jgi:hypothetical protein
MGGRARAGWRLEEEDRREMQEGGVITDEL